MKVNLTNNKQFIEDELKLLKLTHSLNPNNPEQLVKIQKELTLVQQLDVFTTFHNQNLTLEAQLNLIEQSLNSEKKQSNLNYEIKDFMQKLVQQAHSILKDSSSSSSSRIQNFRQMILDTQSIQHSMISKQTDNIDMIDSSTKNSGFIIGYEEESKDSKKKGQNSTRLDQKSNTEMINKSSDNAVNLSKQKQALINLIESYNQTSKISKSLQQNIQSFIILCNTQSQTEYLAQFLKYLQNVINYIPEDTKFIDLIEKSPLDFIIQVLATQYQFKFILQLKDVMKIDLLKILSQLKNQSKRAVPQDQNQKEIFMNINPSNCNIMEMTLDEIQIRGHKEEIFKDQIDQYLDLAVEYFDQFLEADVLNQQEITQLYRRFKNDKDFERAYQLLKTINQKGQCLQAEYQILLLLNQLDDPLKYWADLDRIETTSFKLLYKFAKVKFTTSDERQDLLLKILDHHLINQSVKSQTESDFKMLTQTLNYIKSTLTVKLKHKSSYYNDILQSLELYLELCHKLLIHKNLSIKLRDRDFSIKDFKPLSIVDLKFIVKAFLEEDLHYEALEYVKMSIPHKYQYNSKNNSAEKVRVNMDNKSKKKQNQNKEQQFHHSYYSLMKKIQYKICKKLCQAGDLKQAECLTERWFKAGNESSQFIFQNTQVKSSINKKVSLNKERVDTAEESEDKRFYLLKLIGFLKNNSSPRCQNCQVKKSVLSFDDCQ
eukprot:403333393